MKCDNCNNNMLKIDRRIEMVDLDEDATDGQIADYFAAEESNVFGEWGEGVIEYYCKKCKVGKTHYSDCDLINYTMLIKSWHDKAKSGDYFSRFVFDYLAFAAHLKNNLYYESTSDRDAIQKLKKDENLKKKYLETISYHRVLKNVWQSLIDELNKDPLKNTSYDYDVPEVDGRWNSAEKNDSRKKEVVHALDDWENMIEFWYSVRNNLFHGGKDPNARRDQFMVEHAYVTLSFFIENEIRKMS